MKEADKLVAITVASINTAKRRNRKKRFGYGQKIPHCAWRLEDITAI
jgi:hypothetical protein